MSEQSENQNELNAMQTKLNSALELISQQKFDEAKETLLLLLPEVDKSQKEILQYYLMNIALAKLDYKQALEYCNEILESQNMNQYTLAALFYTPYCTKQLGDVEGANTMYNQALDFFAKQSNLDLTNTTLHMYEILCLYEVRQYALALNLINLLPSASQNNPEYMMLRSTIEKAIGDEKAAETDKEDSVKAGGFIANILNIADITTKQNSSSSGAASAKQ